MEQSEFTIETMSSSEVEIAVEWAAQEGWNPGLHDAQSFFAADPNGFLIGKMRGEPIATISVVKYSESFGFLGLYIVKPQYRGKGYGIQIWNAGLEYLAGCNVGLDGVIEQQGNYKKSGFQLAYRNIRYEGVSEGLSSNVEKVVNLSSLPLEVIASYDRDFFPASRLEFLQSWINQPKCVPLGFLQDGKLAGYGVSRACLKGYKIGPLFADSPQIAEALFVALKASLPPGQPIYLDIPEVNKEALDLVKRHAMQPVFETARMYTKEAPHLTLERLYGVTTFELG